MPPEQRDGLDATERRVPARLTDRLRTCAKVVGDDRRTTLGDRH